MCLINQEWKDCEDLIKAIDWTLDEKWSKPLYNEVHGKTNMNTIIWCFIKYAKYLMQEKQYYVCNSYSGYNSPYTQLFLYISKHSDLVNYILQFIMSDDDVFANWFCLHECILCINTNIKEYFHSAIQIIKHPIVGKYWSFASSGENSLEKETYTEEFAEIDSMLIHCFLLYKALWMNKCAHIEILENGYNKHTKCSWSFKCFQMIQELQQNIAHKRNGHLYIILKANI